MKFKAVIGNEGKTILATVAALQKIERSWDSKTARPWVALRLSRESFVICHKGNGLDDFQTWAHLRVANTFPEYRLESKRSNLIDLEVHSLKSLYHALRSCADGVGATVKLAKRDSVSVLCFEFSMAGVAADGHKVSTKVPVRVLSDSEASAFKEPELPEPEFQIQLPSPLIRVRTVVDKMRAVGATRVEIRALREVAGGTGEQLAQLRLCCSAEELVSIETCFPRLRLVEDGKDATTPQNQTVSLTMALKRMQEMLQGLASLPTSANIACIVVQKAFVLYSLLPRDMGTMICYVPAVYETQS